MKNTITFDKKLTRWIVGVLGYQISPKTQCILDKDGYFVPALHDEGPVCVKDFVGAVMTKKGPRLITRDISSIIRLSDHLREKNR